MESCKKEIKIEMVNFFIENILWDKLFIKEDDQQSLFDIIIVNNLEKEDDIIM